MPSVPPSRSPEIVCFDLGGVLIRICHSWEEACLRANLSPPNADPATAAARRALFVRHERGELAPVELFGQARAGSVETRLDAIGPGAEIGCQALAHRQVRLVQFQGKAADGAGVQAFAVSERPAVAAEQREDALDGIGDVAPGRLQQHRPDALVIGIQHGEQQVLLAGKEMVEAAAVDARPLQHVSDAGGAVTLF